MRKMNAVDFAEKFTNTDIFQEYISEALWHGRFNADKALTLMLDNAEERGVDIVNLDLFDSDNFFWEVYNALEESAS